MGGSEQVLLLGGISALRGSTLPFSGQNNVGGPDKCAIFLHSSHLVYFSI